MPATGKKRILILEPDESVETLLRFLRLDPEIEADVDHVRSHQAAFMILREPQSHFDLLITNHRPEAHFPAFVMTVGKICPDLPIILYTGGLALNADALVTAVVQKPDCDSLRAQIKRTLAQAEEARA